MKNSLLFFLCFLLMLGCRPDAEMTPETPPQEIPYQEIPPNVFAQNTQGATPACNLIDLANCDSDQAILNVCFSCEACATNTDLANYRYVQILIESLPDRTAWPIGVFELDEDYSYEGILCADVIPNQQNHIIAFNLLESDTAIGNDYIVFNNIILAEQQLAAIKRTITADELETAPDCELMPDILFSENPNEAAILNKAFNACLIGSYGDCWVNSPIESLDEWEARIASIKMLVEQHIAAQPQSNPCSGIYISFE